MMRTSRTTVLFLILLAVSELYTSSTLAFSPVIKPTQRPTASSSTAIHSKNSDRAHIERNLEEAMDNDWRVFRAKLVAQERASTSSSSTDHSRSDGGFVGEPKKSGKQQAIPDHGFDNDNLYGDGKLQRQGQIGDLFAGAINSIFKGHHEASRAQRGGSDNILDGSTVGGLRSRKWSTEHDIDLEQDPFVSEAELPILIKPKVPAINKHRWAHDIPHIEPGCVLIANEKLGGVFHQTVVLIIEHHQTTGTFGVVINRPLEGDLRKIGSGPGTKLDLSLRMAFAHARVSYGGPVLTEEYSILHSFGEVDGARKLCPGVYIGGSEELMNCVRGGRLDPTQALFVKGHAAWVPGQLQREISKGVWYTAAASSDLILRYAGAPITDDDEHPNDLWTDIMHCMGGKFTEIARRHGGTGDSRRVLP